LVQAVQAVATVATDQLDTVAIQDTAMGEILMLMETVETQIMELS
jgi:hypothetical protein